MTIQLSEQQKAILHWTLKGTGHLIMQARAGCGKSFTIIESVEAIIKNDWTIRIFIGAFNKAIADGMKVKLEDRGISFPECNASTMHSAGFSALRKLVGRVKVDDKKVGRIFFKYLDTLSERKQDQMRGYIRFFARTISLAKQNGFGVVRPFDDPDEWETLIDHYGLEDSLPEDDSISIMDCITLAIQFYETSLEQCRYLIDFDDMILAPLYYDAQFPKKDWVFIDEAQDLNATRREMAVRMLKPKTGRLVAVGDDKQAIYGFTGADSDSLEIIANRMSAVTLPLTVTYRCAKSIIVEAQQYVPDIEAHPDAREGLVRQLSMEKLMEGEYQGLTPNDVILCRLNKPLVRLAYQFIKQGKGCYIEGRDIGKGLIELAQKWKRVHTVDQLVDQLGIYVEAEQNKWNSRGRPEMAQSVIDKVDCLYIICEQVPEGIVGDVVREVEKIFGDTPRGRKPKVVTLSSIHKSKGREWNRVYILGYHELIPLPFAQKDWQIGQEHNLAYVGITRAINELVYLGLDMEEK